MKVDMNKAEFRAAYQGRTYYFASGANRNKYKKDPNAFSYRAID